MFEAEQPSSESSGKRKRYVIGWREFVSLPEWGIQGVEAKIDTGARTSALHVDNVRRVRPGRIRFEVILSRKNPTKRVPAVANVVRISRIRTSTGHRQARYVVATRIRIGSAVRTIELSLVRREKLVCRMLLGRSALDGFLIDAGRRYVLGKRKDRKGKPKRKHP